jgi:transposase-like protein
MTPANFNHLLEALKHLTDQQTQHVQDALKGDQPIQLIVNSLETRMLTNPECPHCHCDQIKRHGKMGIMQRYRCKSCGKTFNAATKTPLAGLHYKDKWLEYLKCMIEGRVLRESARICGIDLKTSFHWRHRFLQLPAQLKAASLQGIVEVDETLFRHSEKGSKHLTRPARKRGGKASKPGRSKEDWVPVLTARDRGKHTYEKILPSVCAQEINHALKGKIAKDSVLCSDGLRSYIKVADEQKLIHKQLNVSAGIRVIDKVFHIQNVNAYHHRLKDWLARFHGVATRYLENYLGWFRFLDAQKKPNENNLFRAQQQLMPT